MPRILEGCKARTRSLGNAVMKIAYATLICPLQAGALIQSLITCSQTSIASQTLTAAEYQMSCYSVFPSKFIVPISLWLHVIFTVYSPVLALNTELLISSCAFSRYFSCSILQLDPQRHTGILLFSILMTNL